MIDDDTDDITRIIWRSNANKLITNIQTDHVIAEMPDTYVTLTRVRNAVETVLVLVPRDQVDALRRAFPDVQVVGPRPAIRSVKGRLEPDTPGKLPEIEDFDVVTTLVGDGKGGTKIGGSGSGGFGGGGFGPL